jgi:hypothetical protein
MKKVIINYSGHPLSQDAKEALGRRYDLVVQPDPIIFDFSADANSQLESVAKKTLYDVDADSVLTIIPPGQPTLAILLISYLHGLLGHFPNLCYLELGQDGMYLPKSEYEYVTQNSRTAGRLFRTRHYKA